MKTFVILILSIIVFAYTSELKESPENEDSDSEANLAEEMAGWGPYFREGIDPCPNATFLSRCVFCTCAGEKSADCDRGPSCFVPDTPLPVNPPCELGKKLCIGPINCVCDSENNNLATCDGNNYTTCGHIIEEDVYHY